MFEGPAGDFVHVAEFPDAEAVGGGEVEEAEGGGREGSVDVQGGCEGCFLVVGWTLWCQYFTWNCFFFSVCNAE